MGTRVRGHILPPPGTAPGAPKSAARAELGLWEAWKSVKMREANEDPVRQIGALPLLRLLIAEPN